MSRRINVILHDDVWRFPKKVPQGEGSRTINPALRDWTHKRRRLDAAAPSVRPDATA